MKNLTFLINSLVVIFIFFLIPHAGFTQCSPSISIFPYQEDFEVNNGGWTTGHSGPALSDWAWGHPNKTYINGAASGNKCWISGGLTGNFYNDSELSWLKSPCFNFSTLSNPIIGFKIYWETEKNYDGAVLQYSTNAGVSWSNVGSFNEAPDCYINNWYNQASIQYLNPPLVTVSNGWAGSHTQTGTCPSSGGSLGWVTAQHSLNFLGGRPSVIFRFVFGAGSSCNNFNGVAIDSIFINETPALPNPLFSPINPVCQGAIAPVLPNTSSNGVTGTWSPVVSTAIPGTITYTFTPASGQCFSSTTTNIVVNPLPVNVSAGPHLSTQAGVGIQLQASAPPSLIYQWTPSTGLSGTTILNPIAAPTQTTTYHLQVENSFGCITTDSTIVSIKNCSIDPSRIFTPNNDGFYDKWVVFNGSCIKKVNVSVYNRWGGLVYYSENYQNDWDGTYKNKPLPDATYYYVIDVNEITGRNYLLKGNVTIQR